nr:hypothetical protein [uncultured Arsenicibacter sp.]
MGVIESLASAVYQAKLRDLPLIKYEFGDQHHERRVDDQEIAVEHFPQTWGSSALGFANRVGMRKLTVAYTTIVSCLITEVAAVYFDGIFAYTAPTTSDNFHADTILRQVVSVDRAAERYKI